MGNQDPSHMHHNMRQTDTCIIYLISLVTALQQWLLCNDDVTSSLAIKSTTQWSYLVHNLVHLTLSTHFVLQHFCRIIRALNSSPVYCLNLMSSYMSPHGSTLVSKRWSLHSVIHCPIWTLLSWPETAGPGNCRGGMACHTNGWMCMMPAVPAAPATRHARCCDSTTLHLK